MKFVVDAIKRLEASCGTRDEFLVIAGAIASRIGPHLPAALLEATGLSEPELHTEIAVARSRWKSKGGRK